MWGDWDCFRFLEFGRRGEREISFGWRLESVHCGISEFFHPPRTLLFFLTSSMSYAILSSMNDQKRKDNLGDDGLLDAIRACGPVAKGSLSSVRMKCAKKGCAVCRDGGGHPAWIFAYREGGRRKCLYVRKRDVQAVRAALDRGRRLEALLLEEGVRLIKSLRSEADAD